MHTALSLMVKVRADVYNFPRLVTLRYALAKKLFQQGKKE